MSKEVDYLYSYNYLDSQRLKETFFSPEQNKPSTKQITLLSSIIITLLVTLSILFFLLRYDILVIPRNKINPIGANASLFHPEMLSSVHVLGEDKKLKEVKRSPVYSPIPSQEKIGMRILLKKTVNLKNNALLVSLKNAHFPLKIGIVVRDNRCFSNSLKPFIIEAKETQESSYIQIPIILDNLFLQNTNLSNINQISLYFYPQYNQDLNWVLVKDILLVKKNQLFINSSQPDKKYIHPESTSALLIKEAHINRNIN